MFAPFPDSFLNDSLLQPMQHLSQVLLHVADIAIPLLITAALISAFCSHEDSDLGY